MAAIRKKQMSSSRGGHGIVSFPALGLHRRNQEALAGKHFSISMLLAAVLVPAAAHAALWQFEPSLSLQARFDDNPELNVGNTDTVTASVVKGSVAIRSLTETRDVRGFLKGEAFSYSGGSTNLRSHVNYIAGINSSWKRPLTKWTFDGSVRRDTILSDITLIENPGDVTIEPDDNVDTASVQKTVKRSRVVLKPSWSHSLTELTGVRLSYRYNTVNYDPLEGTGLEEFRDHTLRGEYYRSISERDEFAGSLELEKYDAPDAERNYKGYTIEGVYRRKFDETTDGQVRAGVFRTDFTTSLDTGTENGYVYDIEGTKRTGVTRYSVRLRRTLFPAGAGDLVRTDEAVLNAFRRLSERSSISLRSRVFQNRSLRPDNPDANRRYLSVEPRYRWRMAPSWFVDFSYRYQRQKRDTDLESAASNALIFSVSYFEAKPLN